MRKFTIPCRSPLTLMWLSSNSRIDWKVHHMPPWASDMTSSKYGRGGDGAVGTHRARAEDSTGLQHLAALKVHYSHLESSEDTDPWIPLPGILI